MPELQALDQVGMVAVFAIVALAGLVSGALEKRAELGEWIAGGHGKRQYTKASRAEFFSAPRDPPRRHASFLAASGLVPVLLGMDRAPTRLRLTPAACGALHCRWRAIGRRM